MNMSRHPADLISLTFGLAFAAIGVVLLIGSIDEIRFDWVVPAAAIIVGVIVIVAARPVRSQPDDQPTES
jgi:hypothetical protein